MQTTPLNYYLLSNATYVTDNSGHSKLLDEIARSPSSIGITEPAETYMEVRLVDGGKTKGKVDVVVLTQSDLYLIEAKTFKRGRNDKTTANQWARMFSQLQTAQRYFAEHFEASPRLIGVLKRKGSKEFHHHELTELLKK